MTPESAARDIVRLAAALTLAAIGGLVQLAGPVYTRAILHSGPALSLRDVWRDRTASGRVAVGVTVRDAEAPRQPAYVAAEGRTAMTETSLTRYRMLITVVTGVGVVLDVAVAVFTSDVIIGVAAGAGFIAITENLARGGLANVGHCRDPTIKGMTSPSRFSLDEARAAGERIGVDWDSAPFDVEQFRMGMDVELEHGTRDSETNVTDDDVIVTAKIARAHLNEFPDYYTRLARMEAEAEAEANGTAPSE